MWKSSPIFSVQPVRSRRKLLIWVLFCDCKYSPVHLKSLGPEFLFLSPDDLVFLTLIVVLSV